MRFRFHKGFRNISDFKKLHGLEEIQFFCYYQPNPAGLREGLAALISLGLFSTSLQPGPQISALLLVKKNNP